MKKHSKELLQAFYDEALGPRKRQQVEAHLESCLECQAEFEALGSLSSLLSQVPEAQDISSSETFVAQVQLSLPREQEFSMKRDMLRGAWYALPVISISLTVFLQAFFLVSLVFSGLLLFASPDFFSGTMAEFMRNAQDLQASSGLDISISWWGNWLMEQVGLGGSWGYILLINILLPSLAASLFLIWGAGYMSELQRNN